MSAINSSSLVQTTTLRVITALSLGTGLFWVAGIVTDVFLGIDLSAPSLVVFVIVALVVVAGLPTITRSGFLESPACIQARRFSLTLIAAVLGAYLLLIPMFAFFGWCVTFLSAGDGPVHSETSIFIGLVAVWLPLWWAPGVGSWIAWRILRRRTVDLATPA